ncbi:hypothetical protein [Pediococcus cellicola]|nr:hypothetical protein [Pediococcus cellicola]GEL15275.1 hypothetical protein PCE01_10770 [Pediococcus cellicola]
MKWHRKWTWFIGVAVLGLSLVLTGCSNSSTETGRAVVKSQAPKVSRVAASKQIRNNGGLWYFTRSLKDKSNSGLEVFTFDKKGKVTAYNVKKYYRSYQAAKKAKGLREFGQGTYQMKTNQQKQTTLTLKMKLSGIPATYQFKLMKAMATKHQNLIFNGFKASRTVDGDTVNGLFVQAK